MCSDKTTNMKSSPHLLAFYKEWLQWAESDQDHNKHNVFCTEGGLCSNLEFWAGNKNLHAEDLTDELTEQFVSSGLDNFYPFGFVNYTVGCSTKSQHKDEKRLNWVKERIADMEEEQ